MTQPSLENIGPLHGKSLKQIWNPKMCFSWLGSFNFQIPGRKAKSLEKNWVGERRGTQLLKHPQILDFWVVAVSNIFYFHPENWGKIPILTSIFFGWVEPTN